MTQPQLEVLTWWYGQRDYATGLQLLSSYCKNKMLVQHLGKPGKEQFLIHVNKLHYEVTRAVNLDWLKMPPLTDQLLQVSANSPADTSPEKQPAQGQKPEIQNPPADSSVCIKPTTPSIQDFDQFPKVIRRLKYESSELYNQRSILHTKLRSYKNNDSNSIAARKDIIEQIKTISAKLNLYYVFIAEYEKTGIVPDENTVWPEQAKPDPEKPKTADELKKEKWSLHRDNNKDRCKLLYQQRTKAEKENPMPEGPKRDAILQRIKLRESKMAEIEHQLNAIENALKAQ